MTRVYIAGPMTGYVDFNYPAFRTAERVLVALGYEVENPVQHKHAVAAHGQGRPSQTVQPFHFGHLESKRTCYWLRGLPPLRPTDDRTAEAMALPASVRGRIHHVPPGPDRWRVRSVSYPGIAEAMATQWGALQ